LKPELIDFDLRKCIHIKLMTETHAGLRVELLQRKLSMQEVFEEVAQRIVAGDPTLAKILDQTYEKKKTRAIRQLSKTDADTLLDLIEDEGPLGKEK